MGSSIDKYEDTHRPKNAIDPPHYTESYPVEVIQLMQGAFKEAFGADWKVAMQGYMLGNELKYRLRAGFKSPHTIIEDINKALKYNKMRKDVDHG